MHGELAQAHTQQEARQFGIPGDLAAQADRESVYHLYVVQSERRDALREWLQSQDIGAGIHYPSPVHHQPAYAGIATGPRGLAHTERAAQQVLSLPLFPELEEAGVDRVIAACQSFPAAA